MPVGFRFGNGDLCGWMETTGATYLKLVITTNPVVRLNIVVLRAHLPLKKSHYLYVTNERCTVAIFSETFQNQMENMLSTFDIGSAVKPRHLNQRIGMHLRVQRVATTSTMPVGHSCASSASTKVALLIFQVFLDSVAYKIRK